jgi:hypothetical protein
VSAGANTLYLNVSNVQGSPLTTCGATMTTAFTMTQLP